MTEQMESYGPIPVERVVFLTPWIEILFKSLPNRRDRGEVISRLVFAPYRLDRKRRMLVPDDDDGILEPPLEFGNPGFFDLVYRDWMIRHETTGRRDILRVARHPDGKNFEWMTLPPVYLSEEDRELIGERVVTSPYVAFHSLDLAALIVDVKLYMKDYVTLEGCISSEGRKDVFEFPPEVERYSNFRKAKLLIARATEGTVSILAAHLRYPRLPNPLYAVLIKRSDMSTLSFYSLERVIPFENIPVENELDRWLLNDVQNILRAFFKFG